MTPQRFSRALLFDLRNHILLDELFFNKLDLPSKESENRLRFLCPVCRDFNTAVNPETNLGRCFRCQTNFNPIDLVMAVKKIDFIQAINFLIPILEHCRIDRSGGVK